MDESRCAERRREPNGLRLRAEIGPDPQGQNGAHHHPVDREGRERGRHEAPLGVEQGGDERGERHAGHERKGEPGAQGREVETGRVAGKARGEREHDGAGGHLDDRDQRRKRERRRGERSAREGGRRVGAALGPDSGIERNEARVQAALAQDASGQIRKPERDQERVGRRPRPKRARDQHIAQKARTREAAAATPTVRLARASDMETGACQRSWCGVRDGSRSTG
jgi:hypothetical protein